MGAGRGDHHGPTQAVTVTSSALGPACDLPVPAALLPALLPSPGHGAPLVCSRGAFQPRMAQGGVCRLWGWCRPQAQS